jgi:O-antigen/teichoic acid export membrane protein
MSRSAVILRNVASNWTGFLVHAVITLALTPYVLHSLGVARYGIWILASSIIGYYGLLDAGIRAGVQQYLTRCIAIGDFRGAGEVLSSAVALLAMLAGVMVLLSVGGALFAPRIFDFGAEGAHEAGWCILLLGMNSALGFAFAPFSAVFVATQRLDIANLIGIGTRVLSALAIVLALRLGWGLIGLATVTLVVNSADYVIRWRVARYLTPELEVSLRTVRLAALRDIASFGAWNFLISLNSFIYSYVPNLLIGAFQPMAAVGHYALATNLSRQVNSVLSPIGQAMYPAATQLHSQGDGQRLQRLYHDGSRLMMLAMIPVVLGGMVWATDFYRLWIGEKYLTSPQFESVAVLFRLLLLSVVTNYVSSVAQQILTGAGHIRPVALALFGGSVISLSLSVVLIQVIGLAGVALATVAASVVIDLIAVPIMLQRLVGLSIADFLRRSCVRPLVCGMLQAGVIFLVRLDGPALDWMQLIMQGMFAGFGMLMIVVAVGLTTEERRRFLLMPASRLWRRIFRGATA